MDFGPVWLNIKETNKCSQNRTSNSLVIASNNVYKCFLNCSHLLSFCNCFSISLV